MKDTQRGRYPQEPRKLCESNSQKRTTPTGGHGTPKCYLLPVETVNQKGADTMKDNERILEQWRESQDHQQDLLEAIQTLIPDGDCIHPIITLILAYGDECRAEVQAIHEGGYASNDEARVAWVRSVGNG